MNNDEVMRVLLAEGVTIFVSPFQKLLAKGKGNLLSFESCVDLLVLFFRK
jgi:hypothetical protein